MIAPASRPAVSLRTYRVVHAVLAAHFASLAITYLVDHYYNPDDELGVAWDDPELGVTWPSTTPELSGRDRTNPKRSEISPDLRPV